MCCQWVERFGALMRILDKIEYLEMRFRHTLLTALQALATGMTVVDAARPTARTRCTHGFSSLVFGKGRYWAENRRGYRRSQFLEKVQMGSQTASSCDSHSRRPDT